MTYSIVALDPATGDLGVAVQSKFLAVGAVVPWAKAGVGAIATQSFANVRYGPDGLALLAGGASANEALDRLVAGDALRSQRQAGIVDAAGRSATHTGDECFAWAGGQAGPGFAAQGNILAGPAVVDGLVDTLLAGGRPFPELLVACLAAADDAGGDRRGREGAALYIVREAAGYGGGNDRWVDLRVDHSDDPIGGLGRLLDLQRLYLDRSTSDQLVPITEDLARELRQLMSAIGAEPGGRFGGVFQPMWQFRGLPAPTAGMPAPGSTSGDGNADAERPMTGTPRELPDGWTMAWHDALGDWMGVVNLEERLAAPGWIDPRVLAVLRESPADQ
ncbi:MAG TPA: DUF1028 domain-containing protein [Candidatus Limnocylindrales bacterium]|nr:DUF1028 domain-containing protein [Candidatus Limnocylindrales bacterium]